MRKKLAASGVVVAGLFVAAAALAWTSPWPKEGMLPEGLKVAGEVIAGAGNVDAVIARRATDLLSRQVTLALPREGGEPRVLATATLESLGVRVDRERTKRWVESATTGDVAERLETARAARQGAIDVPLALSFDREKTTSLLAELKEAEDADPVSARLDLAKRTVVPERMGRYLDAHRAADEVARFAGALSRGESPDPRLVLASQAFPPRMSTAFVKGLDVSQTLGQFETYFSRRGDQARRAKNIEVAAAKLDGLILAPGELVSFNQVVGDRSEENGFEKAWEIFKGEMKEGVGGGTCQVASTFHAAAIFAGIEILERLPHSRPSAYIPLGLDATVVYPVVDMKMRNPHAFPVAIHTAVEGNKVRFEVLGPKKPGHVVFGREITETLPYARKVEEDPAVPRDRIVVKQHGIRGFRVKRTREIVFANGERRVETSKDFYPPTFEIFKVAPGFDLAKLPPPAFDPETGEPTGAATAASTPTSTLTGTSTPTGTTSEPAPTPEFKMVDAPGAHAPSKRQAEPETTLRIRR